MMRGRLGKVAHWIEIGIIILVAAVYAGHKMTKWQEAERAAAVRRAHNPGQVQPPAGAIPGRLLPR